MAIREISRDAILSAIAEFEEIGREAFLAKYGFRPSYLYQLVHNGKHYDSKAIIGAAQAIQFPGMPVPNFWGGDQVKRVLQQNGSDVTALGPRRQLRRDH